MIAKILQSAQTFEGVNYSEKKNEKGQSELLVAKNFDGLPSDATKQDYINYMEMVCRTNDRVKNVQFHATISCKEREYNAEQLKDIAVQYIEKMGYSENPYIVYFHSDTNNNHVHVVSTRVKKNGEKVSDKLERIKSQKVIAEIMNLNVQEQAMNAYEKALTYNFSTVPQFKMILEQKGYFVKENEGNIILCKGHEAHYQVSGDVLKNKIQEHKTNDERLKQLKAIIHKYKAGLNHSELQKLLKDEGGVELLFHVGKGHTTPYGYTILDHAKKNVFKGSELYNIKELISSPEREAKIKYCTDIVSLLLNEGHKHTIDSFKGELKNYGYRFDKQGKIYLTGERTALFSLDNEELKKLRYNSRAEEASKYKPTNKNESKVLSQIYFVKADDIILSESKDKTDNFIKYSDMMKSFITQSPDIKESLAEKKIRFFNRGNELFLIDTLNKEIISSDELNIKLEQDKDLDRVVILNSDKLDKVDIYNNPDMEKGFDMVNLICEFIGQNFNSYEEDIRKRRRKGQQRQ